MRYISAMRKLKTTPIEDDPEDDPPSPQVIYDQFSFKQISYEVNSKGIPTISKDDEAEVILVARDWQADMRRHREMEKAGLDVSLPYGTYLGCGLSKIAFEGRLSASNTHLAILQMHTFGDPSPSAEQCNERDL
ncbi:hypothetical protein JAAARDRAFT_193635 [Jaapia argillacea MUCL 33604]|uniref:Uncharacterized protein n=1 Tax=Jaapia argillacea MUCL 33604 TaxID=933084 RepID=A0A067PWG2_9AGAM|nr:hypothetical protein JAAARDRAFT_193635 [Jaapia argillacea MUCL 33604]